MAPDPILDAADSDAIVRALRDSDDRLRSVINSAYMVLWALDANGIFTFSDGGALRRLGLRPGEVVGRSVFDVYAGHPSIVEDNRRALAGEEFTTTAVLAGAMFETRYAVQRDAAGAVSGVIGVAVDVSDRLRIAEEREHSLSLLRATLESTAEGILVIDNDGRIVTYNRKFLEMWRLDEADVADGDATRAVACACAQLCDGPAFEADIRDLAAHPDAQAHDTLDFTDGRTYERYTQPQRIGDRIVGRVWTFRDITTARRAEDALRRRAEQAARFQEALVRLARFRSDELDATLRNIVRVDAATLDVERVSVWIFSDDGAELVCRTLHDGNGGREAGPLRAAELPDYFAALHENRVIAASDALTDPATHEFADSYLKPLGITSMLDVPIWRGGRMAGVVCHEHVGGRRDWTVEEQDFAASIADMVSLALE
jgi:PAS domain S-box-containing protein